MKNFATLVAALFVMCSVRANILTVNNNAFSPGHFTSLQTAIDSANAGDSIYVEPTPDDYGSITLTRKVYLFGGGGQPNTYQINNATTVDAVTFSNQTLPPMNSSGSELEGFSITSGLTVNGGMSNINIIRNYFTSGLQISGSDTNISIINNIFNGQQILFYSSYNNDNTVLIANNFFNNADEGGNYGEGMLFENSGSQFQQQGVQFLNNICYSQNQNSGYPQFFRYINAATVKNNIFYDYDPSGAFSSGCVNCIMDNNITFSDGLSSTVTLPDAGNSGQNNYNNVGSSPFAGNIPNYQSITSNALYTYNWNVTNTYATSGSDGTPIGIYGGSYPMPNFEGVTRLPQVRSIQINNPTVGPNGTLNVTTIGTTRN